MLNKEQKQALLKLGFIEFDDGFWTMDIGPCGNEIYVTESKWRDYSVDLSLKNCSPEQAKKAVDKYIEVKKIIDELD